MELMPGIWMTVMTHENDRRGQDPSRRSETAREETVRAVTPFRVEDTGGGWPCGCCGGIFPVGDSWRIRFSRTGTVIACPECAQNAAKSATIQRSVQRRDPLVQREQPTVSGFREDHRTGRQEPDRPRSR
jgi:hypothetical protein